MEVNDDVIHYVFVNCQSLFTKDEKDAYVKMSFEADVLPKYKDKPTILEHFKAGRGYKNNYPGSVLDLLKDGHKEFRFNTTLRILKEQGNNPLFNYCPKCGKLARTPDAKQCRFCLHDWH